MAPAAVLSLLAARLLTPLAAALRDAAAVHERGHASRPHVHTSIPPHLHPLGVSILLLLTACADAPLPPPRVAPPPIRAVTLDARHPPEPELLPRLRALGATHLCLVPFGFQERPDAPVIRMHTSGGWYSESDAGIRTLARRADSLGLGLILKPHVWIGHYSAEGQERHRVAFGDEAGWQQWEAHYRRFLLHYARLANEVDADVLVVGTELAHAARTRPAFWRALVDSVRAAYDGKLTYAANWYQEYRQIPFWDALDYVGVQAYFPLTRWPDPSLQTLAEGWTEHRRELAAVHRTTGKPILLTELGYRSVRYAAREPWRWPSRDEASTTPPDTALQRRLYDAFFRTLWREPWLTGAVVWKWHPAQAGDRPLGFTPQGKPAEEAIARGFQAR